MTDDPYKAPLAPDPDERRDRPSLVFWGVVVVLGAVAMAALGLRFREVVVWMVLPLFVWAGVSLYLLLMGDE